MGEEEKRSALNLRLRATAVCKYCELYSLSPWQDDEESKKWKVEGGRWKVEGGRRKEEGGGPERVTSGLGSGN
jgi:hypothetical protein